MHTRGHHSCHLGGLWASEESLQGTSHTFYPDYVCNKSLKNLTCVGKVRCCLESILFQRSDIYLFRLFKHIFWCATRFCLGPLLFVIYINDLPNVSKLLSFYLLADDTNIYFKSNELTHLQKIMNRELKKVKKWLDGNRLALDIDKTNFVIFHPPRIKLPEPVIIRFCRKKIQRENCVKFLGVLLHCNLSWKYHINEFSKKLSRTIGIFYKIRHFVPCEILKTLYYSLFYSFVSYGIAVWGFTYKSHIQKLSLLQKKIIRVMAFKNKHSNPIFSKLELLKIEDIRQLQLLSFVFDCQNKIAPVYFHENFVQCSQIHHFNTRLASRGDLFWRGKIPFNMVLRQLNTMVLGFGICFR